MAQDFGKLIIRSQADERTITLTSEPITIGRNPDNGLVLESQAVSRRHAELRPGPNGPLLTDLGSTGGTVVGTGRLLPNQPQLLAPGVEVHIGPYTLIYLAAEPAEVSEGDPQPEPEPERQAEPQPEQPTATGDGQTPVAEEERPEPVLVEEEVAPITLFQELALLPGRQSERYYAPMIGGYSRYLRFLPAIFQDNDFMGRYLEILESVWEPLEWRQNHVHMYFDPRTCPEPLLEWLAGWLDLSLNQHWPEARRRRLLAEATDLYRWRGTRYGLTRMIEVCTGLTPEVSDDPNQPFVFNVTVNIPKDSDVDMALIDDLVRIHKPAHAGYTLIFT